MAMVYREHDNLKDTILAGGLVTSPGWVPWLSLNASPVLTVATLAVGFALGVLRCWGAWEDLQERRHQRKITREAAALRAGSPLL